jgi:hypothetical protein
MNSKKARYKKTQKRENSHTDRCGDTRGQECHAKGNRKENNNNNNNNNISVMELGHLLTRSGLTYPEVSSKVCHDSFCRLENIVSLPWVIYYEAFYLHVLSSFSCTPAICPKLVLFLILL